MTIRQVKKGVNLRTTSNDKALRLLGDVSKQVDIVGLGIAEHLPWDAMTLRKMLAALPLIGRPPVNDAE